MADFVPEPRDRLEAPICKAIESKDFKQALKLVEKRLAKNPTDPYLLALRCFILCNSLLVVERGKAFGVILDLSNSSEGRYSAGQLDLYDEGLRVLFLDHNNVEGKAICKMRVEAVKAAPKDEKLTLACFRACLKREGLEYAQQIANSLEKNFPSNRVYQFWSITMTAIYASSADCPDHLARVYSKLAYNKIRNLASSTINDPDVLSTRSLQTPQELLLFYRLLANHGDDAEGIRIFRDKRLGPKSKIAKDEWVFRRKQLDLLGKQNDWQELYDVTYSLLSNSRANNESGVMGDARGADWHVWQEFLRAVSELQSEETILAAQDEIEAHIDQTSGLDRTYRRNALLAFLEFRFNVSSMLQFTGPFRFIHSSPTVSKGLDGHTFALCRYIYQYGQNTSAFDDIKSYIAMMDASSETAFIAAVPHFLRHLVGSVYLGEGYQKGESYAHGRYAGGKKMPLPIAGPESSWNDILSGVTLSKISYFLKSSLAEKRRATFIDRLGNPTVSCRWCQSSCGTYCKTCLQGLAISCIQNYAWTMGDNDRIAKRLKSTDQHPADEWAIIAAMSLMKMAGCRPWVTNESYEMSYPPNRQHLLRAALVLEFAHTNSKPNPQILLMLIRLYSRLGAGSLAMRAYSRLGLKQIQGDTLSYTLLDRISSLHPHTVDDSSATEEARDPSKQLKKLQRLYRTFRNQIVTNSWKSFEHGSYDSIFQLLDVSGKLSSSMTAAMSAIELRRIDRLTLPTVALTPNSHGYDILSTLPANTNYSDNFDYTSFPNYEPSGEYPFEMYTRIGPGPSQTRIQAFFLLEELWMIARSVSDPKVMQTSMQLRLNNLKNVIVNVKETMAVDPKDSGMFTTPEKLLVQIGFLLIDFLAIACDPDLLSQEKVPMATAKMGAEFGELVYQLMNLIDPDLREKEEPDADWMPMFMTTTHPLYTAHEAGTLALAVANYLSKADLWVNPEVKQSVELCLTEFGQVLRLTVSRNARTVMSWINGPRLDHVLAQIQTEDQENNTIPAGNDLIIGVGDFERANGYEKKLLPDTPQTFGELLTECVSPDFLENWASELVDSWRESVIGLACLKSDIALPKENAA